MEASPEQAWRYKAISGVQEMLNLPGIVAMKADFSGGILDRCECRADSMWWILNVTKASEILHPSGENTVPQDTGG